MEKVKEKAWRKTSNNRDYVGTIEATISTGLPEGQMTCIVPDVSARAAVRG